MICNTSVCSVGTLKSYILASRRLTEFIYIVKIFFPVPINIFKKIGFSWMGIQIEAIIKDAPIL
jgi:hypothetical protein